MYYIDIIEYCRTMNRIRKCPKFSPGELEEMTRAREQQEKEEELERKCEGYRQRCF